MGDSEPLGAGDSSRRARGCRGVRWGPMRILTPVVSCVLAASALGCSSAAPALDGDDRVAIQAQAFAIACIDALCPGFPILALDTTPDDLRDAIRGAFPDEVEYIAEGSIESLTGAGGGFPDGGILITVGGVGEVDSGVVAVDVSLSKGAQNLVVRTYLFEWDGEQWTAVSADSVDITVTTSVS